jgi:hypothetical protein
MSSIRKQFKNLGFSSTYGNEPEVLRDTITNSGMVNVRPSEVNNSTTITPNNKTFTNNAGDVVSPEMVSKNVGLAGTPPEPQKNKNINNYKSAYGEYKKQLELNKVNAQNDIAKANRVAQQYLNNYLRQQGVQGSGMGASAVAGLGANYASEIANSNANYDNKLTDYRNTYNENLLSQENLALLQGMDDESAREYIDSVSQDSGVNADTINKLNAYNTQFSKERNQQFADSKNEWLGTLGEAINSGAMTGEELTGYKDAYQAIKNAKTPEEFEQAKQTLADLLNPDLKETAKNPDGSINASKASMSDFGNYLGTRRKDGEQNKHINAVLKAVNSGDIPNGTYIDMNYGNGKDIYLYQNGTFTKVDLSNKDINKYIADGKYISNRKNGEILEKYKK